VTPAVEPDNPEFLAPEMEVADWQAHIRMSIVTGVAADVPRISKAVRANVSCVEARDATTFNSSSGNDSLKQASIVARTTLWNFNWERRFQDKFVLSLG